MIQTNPVEDVSEATIEELEERQGELIDQAERNYGPER